MKLSTDRQAPAPDRLLFVVYVGLGLAALAAARFFPFHLLPPVCALKRLTGQPCLGCGMTRSWVHMAHGRLLEAWLQNPLGSGLFVALVVALTYVILRVAGRIPALRVEFSSGETWTLRGLAVAVLAGNWAYLLLTGVA